MPVLVVSSSIVFSDLDIGEAATDSFAQRMRDSLAAAAGVGVERVFILEVATGSVVVHSAVVFDGPQQAAAEEFKAMLATSSSSESWSS